MNVLKFMFLLALVLIGCAAGRKGKGKGKLAAILKENSCTAPGSCYLRADYMIQACNGNLARDSLPSMVPGWTIAACGSKLTADCGRLNGGGSAGVLAGGGSAGG
jgi:hypothetical protein